MNQTSHTQIRDAVFRALDEVNEQLPPHQRLERAEATPLTGVEGALDSLGVVNLIVALEQQLERRFGTTLDLIDQGVLGDEEPLRNVGALVAFVSDLLDEGAARA